MYKKLSLCLNIIKDESFHSGKLSILSFPKNANLSICLFALHYLKDIDDAEDTVQDCFMELWRRKDRGVDASGLKSYLYSMVRNRCIDTLKKDSLIDSNVQPSDLEEILSDEECEEWAYDEARMWTAIDSLPEKCREVFLLAKREGLKYEEIAVRMGISVHTVKNQMSKAIKTVKAGVQKVYLFFFG